ncbi:hypothetical protein [Actibacterium mucosum]|uniref:hypothetical protein n=1 Tax=Actibacterium mucosum TaxID=1087332 RepID=UPI001268E5E1|nr:hypothetical protein [Actibacterium mucosum]
MKSYFIERITDPLKARQTLSQYLPGQHDPWVLWTRDAAAPVAYLNVDIVDDVWDEVEGPFYIQADISGRNYNEDDYVLSLLRKVQNIVGGVIKDDNDSFV